MVPSNNYPLVGAQGTCCLYLEENLACNINGHRVVTWVRPKWNRLTQLDFCSVLGGEIWNQVKM